MRGLPSNYEARRAEKLDATKAKQESERERAESVRRWLLERLASDGQLVEDLGGGLYAQKARHLAWNAFEIEARQAGYELHEIVGVLRGLGRLHP